MRARVLALGFALACGAPAGPDLPDVILISVDGEQPTIERARLLPDAVVFEQAYLPAPDPIHTHASLLTGLYPDTHGVLSQSDSLAERASTLPELLAGLGYETGKSADADDPFEWLSEGPPRFADIRVARSGLADLLAGLHEAGVLRESLVVFVARSSADDADRALLEPSIRATLWMSLPGVGALRVEDPVQIVDVLPTLLDYLGGEVPKQVQGRSLLPLIRDPDIERAERPVYVRSPSGSQYAVRAGRWKLIQQRAPPRARLFDLSTDPGETRDVADAHPVARARLERLLALWQLAARTARLSD